MKDGRQLEIDGAVSAHVKEADGRPMLRCFAVDGRVVQELPADEVQTYEVLHPRAGPE